MAFLDKIGLEYLWTKICAKFATKDEIIVTPGEGTNSAMFPGATTASGFCSVAEGYETTASGYAAHAEGEGTTASSQSAHAEGYNTTASSYYTHAEGWETTASAKAAHAEGSYTVSKGQQSHAEGFQTIAASTSQHVQGKYNIEDANNTYAHIVGNGSSSTRSNAHTLDWNGNAWFKGDVYVGGTSQSDAIKLPRITTGTGNPPSSGTAGSIYIQYSE